MNQDTGLVVGVSWPISRNATMAIHPYMPTCQLVSESVSAFFACHRPGSRGRPRIGTIVKY